MAAGPRILISYFFGANSIPLGESCAAACEQLGLTVLRHDSGLDSWLDKHVLKRLNKLLWAFRLRFIDLCRLSRWGNENFRRRRLEEDVARFRPDILLVIIGHGFDGDFLRRLKADYRIGHVVGWWVKGPRMFDVMLRDHRYYDHFYCLHREGYDASHAIRHLPTLALDKVLYRNYWDKPQRSYRHAVVFVGSWSEHREKFIAAITDLPVEIYGPGWRRKCWHKPAIRRLIRDKDIWGERLIDLYNHSRIVLNISSWPPNRQSGLNLRVLDVPATGAFLLSEDSPDLGGFFEVDREIAVFATPQALADQVRFYLDHPEQAEQIAWAGYQRANRMPSYADKMAGLLADLGCAVPAANPPGASG